MEPKSIFLLTLAALSAVVFPAYAQEDEGECQLIDAPQLGEGWQRRVCANSDYDSWISPSGEECFANPKEGTTRCGEGSDDPPISVN